MPMFDAHWTLFVAASLLLIIAPGQDMILVMSRAISHGTRAGMTTAAGVSLGLVGHTLLATLGLGALLRTSEWLFTLIKLAGAAYLVVLAVQMLRTRTTELASTPHTAQSHRRMFIAGAMSNISNPKIAIFYFAFLPQFVQPQAAHPTQVVLALGLTFASMTFLVKGPVALFAGQLSGWLRTRPLVIVWLMRLSGLTLLALALRLAFSRRDA